MQNFHCICTRCALVNPLQCAGLNARAHCPRSELSCALASLAPPDGDFAQLEKTTTLQSAATAFPFNTLFHHCVVALHVSPDWQLKAHLFWAHSNSMFIVLIVMKIIPVTTNYMQISVAKSGSIEQQIELPPNGHVNPTRAIIIPTIWTIIPNNSI